jgi:predicted nucleic acid-binding protein
VSERWVVDASPIIALGSIEKLELFAALADEVVVPAAVAQEVRRGRDRASLGLEEAISSKHFRIEEVEPEGIVSRWGLDAGETAVLSFARSNAGYVAIVDDLAARRCASALSIATRGTVGVVLLAKARGLVPLAAPLLTALRAEGLFLSPSLIAAALSLVGEAEKT